MKISIGENTQKAMALFGIEDYPFSETTLKYNYKRLMFQHHPDRNNGETLEQAKLINEAYSKLKNLAMSEPTEEQCNIIKKQHGKEKEDMFVFWESCERCKGTGKLVMKEWETFITKHPKFRVEICPNCRGAGETKLEMYNPVIPKGAILTVKV